MIYLKRTPVALLIIGAIVLTASFILRFFVGALDEWLVDLIRAASMMAGFYCIFGRDVNKKWRKINLSGLHYWCTW